jgi:hypothetical protein
MVLWRWHTITGGKLMLFLAFAVAAAAMSPEGTSPFPPTTGSSGQTRPSTQALVLDYETKAKGLRTEMADLKNSDGGQLTAEHQQYLTKKLISLLDAYHSAVRKDDPMSVNADGTLSR